MDFRPTCSPPTRWRHARRLRASLPSLEHVIVVGEDGDDLGAGECLWSSLADAPSRDFGPGDPTAICYLGFTSGTTGEPKGAMHTHETLLYSAFQLAEHMGTATFGDPMIHLVASPTGHHTGFIWGVVFTVCVGGTGVHVDRWDPAWGVDIIRREKVTTFFGAPRLYPAAIPLGWGFRVLDVQDRPPSAPSTPSRPAKVRRYSTTVASSNTSGLTVAPS